MQLVEGALGHAKFLKAAWQDDQVEDAAWNGRLAASPCRKSTPTAASRAFWLAISTNERLMSSPHT